MRIVKKKKKEKRKFTHTVYILHIPHFIYFTFLTYLFFTDCLFSFVECLIVLLSVYSFEFVFFITFVCFKLF
jgi:hypothetical protein